ncbi:MAG: hypothetical protein ACR2LV_07220 [Solirubrobacteraceae bacterium]
MQAVATALMLPENQAPTTSQFDQHARELDLPWNVSSVGRAFAKWQGWRRADRGLRGCRLPESVRQIRQRRYLTTHRHERVAQPATVRTWLDQNPPDESAEAYMLWSAARNEQLLDTASPLVVA